LPWLSSTHFKFLFIFIITIIITAKPWQQQQWECLVRKWSPWWLPWCSVLLIRSSKKCNFEPSNCNVCALHTPAEDAIWWNRDTSWQDKLAIETALQQQKQQQQQQQQQRCKPLSEWLSFAGMVWKVPSSQGLLNHVELFSFGAWPSSPFNLESSLKSVVCGWAFLAPAHAIM
jgi:hypothetical protein